MKKHEHAQSGAVITQFNATYIFHKALQVLPRAEFALTKDTPYLALTGELWAVFCEDIV